MKYKYIPEPALSEGEEKRPLYRKNDDVFTAGWEIGHYVGTEGEEEWVKIREEMTLSPEAEEEWQRQQREMPPTVTARVDNLENGMDALTGVSE